MESPLSVPAFVQWLIENDAEIFSVVRQRKRCQKKKGGEKGAEKESGQGSGKGVRAFRKGFSRLLLYDEILDDGDAPTMLMTLAQYPCRRSPSGTDFPAWAVLSSNGGPRTSLIAILTERYS